MNFAPYDISKIPTDPAELAKKGRGVLRTIAVRVGAVPQDMKALNAFDQLDSTQKATKILAALKEMKESPAPAAEPAAQAPAAPETPPPAPSQPSPAKRGRPKKNPVPDAPAPAAPAAPPADASGTQAALELLQDTLRSTEAHAAKASANTQEIYRIANEAQLMLATCIRLHQATMLMLSQFAEGVSGGNITVDDMLNDAIVDYNSVDISTLVHPAEGKA